MNNADHIRDFDIPNIELNHKNRKFIFSLTNMASASYRIGIKLEPKNPNHNEKPIVFATDFEYNSSNDLCALIFYIAKQTAYANLSRHPEYDSTSYELFLDEKDTLTMKAKLLENAATLHGKEQCKCWSTPFGFYIAPLIVDDITDDYRTCTFNKAIPEHVGIDQLKEAAASMGMSLWQFCLGGKPRTISIEKSQVYQENNDHLRIKAVLAYDNGGWEIGIRDDGSYEVMAVGGEETFIDGDLDAAEQISAIWYNREFKRLPEHIDLSSISTL